MVDKTIVQQKEHFAKSLTKDADRDFESQITTAACD
jgi:hypothetical protein